MYPDMKGVSVELSRYYGIHVKQQIDHFLINNPDVEAEVYIIEGALGFKNYIKSIYLIPLKSREKDFDIIHTHFGLSGLFLIFSPWLGKKSIVTFHGCDLLAPSRKHIFTRMISKLVAKIAKINIYVSENMESFLNESKRVLIPCGVDSEIFNSKKSLPFLDGKNIKLVFPGSPDREVKCYPLFRQIVSKLEEDGFTVETLIMNGLEQAEVVDMLDNSTGILLTSISEGSPQVVKEALLMNRFVFSVNVGDISKYADFANLFVSTTRDPDELAELIKVNVHNIGSGFNSKDKIIELGLDSNSISQKIKSIYNNFF